MQEMEEEVFVYRRATVDCSASNQQEEEFPWRHIVVRHGLDLSKNLLSLEAFEILLLLGYRLPSHLAETHVLRPTRSDHG